MRLWGQFQACFFFFLQKGLEPKKKHKNTKQQRQHFLCAQNLRRG